MDPIPNPLRFVYVTYPPADAFDLGPVAEAAIEQGLCACVNVFAMQSIYRWEGKLQRDAERVAIFKTTPAALDRLREVLASTHPYEVPCICALEADGNPPFAAWVHEQATPRE